MKKRHLYYHNEFVQRVLDADKHTHPDPYLSPKEFIQWLSSLENKPIPQDDEPKGTHDREYFEELNDE